jgi:hypothetical protein
LLDLRAHGACCNKGERCTEHSANYLQSHTCSFAILPKVKRLNAACSVNRVSETTSRLAAPLDHERSADGL